MMRHFRNITVKEISTLTCDSCGEQATLGDYTFHEFISISHTCGLGSIYGDGKQLSIDLCQQCFFGMCGDILTVIGPTYESSERLENHTRLRLAARDILLAKKITNKEEETIALKRVNVLWDAQHISAETNELYQLMDLVFTYQGISRD